MALSEAGASAILGGINAVGSYFATKGVAKAAQKASEAQRRLIDLQAEEQRLKNSALRASLAEQNDQLPFTVSNPSLPAGAYAGTIKPEGSGAPRPKPKKAGYIIAGAAALTALALFSIKSS